MSKPAGWEGILHYSEHILWQGQPVGRLFRQRKSGAFLIPFSLVWSSFAIFWHLIENALVMPGAAKPSKRERPYRHCRSSPFQTKCPLSNPNLIPQRAQHSSCKRATGAKL